MSGSSSVRGSVMFAGLFTLALLAIFSFVRVQTIQAGTVFYVNVNVDDGLVAYFKFDEGAGAVTRDSAVVNATAALLTGASFIPDAPPAIKIPDPFSLAVDGIHDPVDIQDRADLNLAANFSVAAWVRRVSGSRVDIVYDSGEQPGHWHIGIFTDRVGIAVPGGVPLVSNQNIVNTNWHHIVVAKSGDGPNNVSIYINGAFDSARSLGSVSTPSGKKRIGGRTDNAVPSLLGSIDDLRIYKRALSAAEVSRLYAGLVCVTDGKSWANAFKDLQCGLTESAEGDEVWVANGVYTPGAHRDATFQIKQGIAVYGGFAGIETSRSQRAPFYFPPGLTKSSPNYTTLSGDLHQDDHPTDFINYEENAYHVVVISGTSSATVLDGFIIAGGNADGATRTREGGGGLYLSTANPVLQNLNVIRNKAKSWGGGLTAELGGTSSMTNVQFVANQATTRGGGAISLNDASNIVMFNVYILSNRSEGVGGGLHCESLTCGSTMNTVTFQSNSARVSGGGMASRGIMNLTAVSFVSNTAGFDAGGFENRGLLTMRDSLVVDNQADLDGGGLYSNGPATILDTVFIRNTANNGGAVDNRGSMDIIRTAFYNNTATTNGGGLENRGVSNLQVVTFAGNIAGYGGGYQNEGATTLSRVNFYSNKANADGGGLENRGYAVIERTEIVNNTAQGSGGGLRSRGGTLLIGSLVGSNDAQASASGISAQESLLVLTNTVVLGNLNANLPAIDIYNSSGTLTHVTIGRNLTRSGLEINSSGVLIRNTIVANNAIGISGTASTSVTINSTLLNGNVKDLGGAMQPVTSNLLFGDPKFAPDGIHIQAGSAAIDTASPAGATSDYDGDLRPNGKSPDIGADEYLLVGVRYQFVPVALRSTQTGW